MDDRLRGTSRRNFLAWSGTALGGAVVVNAFGPAGDKPELLDSLAQRMGPAADIFGWPIIMRRPQDQLLLTIRGYNVFIDYNQSPPVLTQTSNVLPSYLTIEFGRAGSLAPMHVTEQAFPLNDSDLPDQNKAPLKQKPTSAVGAPPVGSRIAGGTRLAFQLPASMLAPVADTPLTLGTDDMLSWIGLLLSVVPNAQPPLNGRALPGGVGAPRAPGLAETAIELPYHLVLSPPVRPFEGITDASTVFVNALGPVTHNGWTELWHTRLAARVHHQIGEFSVFAIDETTPDLRTARGIWSTDPSFESDLEANLSDDANGFADKGPPPFTSSLRYLDRYDIVRLSGDFTKDADGGPYLRGRTVLGNIVLNPGYFPSPVSVDRLMLSALGGWLDCQGHWDLAHSKKAGHFNTSLLAWRHRAVQARDSYVRVVRKGYLFPWGHRASLVTVTEREFTAGPGGNIGAYLRQKTFIVVTQPTKSYSNSPGVKHKGLGLPFSDVEALTLVTPDLKAPKKYVSSAPSDESVFQPRKLDGSLFDFHFRGTDWAGDPIDVRTPVLWVDDVVAYADTASRKTMRDDILTKWNAAPANIGLHDQRVSMARPKNPDAAAGDTQVVLDSFKLAAEAPKTGTTAGALIDASQPAYFPTMQSAEVKLPEAATISGNSTGTTTMVYEPTRYLANEFTGNKGGVFLIRKSGATRHGVKFDSDKSGGAFTPNIAIDGLSREIGPLSGNVGDLAQGQFNPKDVFKGLNPPAKLLGGIDIQVILTNVGFGDNGDGTSNNAAALQITSVEHLNPNHIIETLLDWHPSITTGGPTVAGQVIDVFEPTGDPDTSMDLTAKLMYDVDKNISTSHVNGQIREFTLHLFGTDDATHFIDIPFDSLTFHSVTGKKTDVDVEISDGGVQFQGALSFVQELADALSFAGSGLTIDTSGDAIRADLTLAIPSLSVGVFGLENIAFSAGVAIPYNGDPVRFDFAFCSRDNPFQLNIMIFTGGGFVGLGIGPDGVEMLEFSFDFGLGFSIDIGIASGEISLTGGVYYECEKNTDGGQSIDLTAWVKASGGISALGLISVSVELYLALEYQDDGVSSQLAGDATLTISVHIIFFGFDVSVSVHEEFAGSSDTAPARQGAQRALTPLAVVQPPNSFGATMTAADWAEYCTSFALIGS